MSTIPSISVVMPIHNGAAFIARALTTVFAQTFGDFELLVVDDASTDDLASALGRFPDPRLRTIRHAVNKGAAAARNSGIGEARGAYVAFIDCDDEWLPEKLARQHALLESCTPEIGVSITGYFLVRDRLGRREARPLTTPDDWYLRLLSGSNVSFGSCAMVRRQLFEQFGGFETGMRRQEDWDWLLRYAAHRRIASIEEPLAVIHTGLGWPSVETVEQASRQIWERHAQAAAAHSPNAARLLESTLRYERAAALYHHRRPLAAILPALHATLLYPARGKGFYRHLFLRVGDVVRGRFG